MKRLTSRTVKWLALVLMVGDHLAFFFPDIFPIWFRYLGRIVAPIFLWLVVQNATRTQNPKQYLLRLGAFALAMSIGTFALVFYGYRTYGVYAEAFLGVNILIPLFIAACASLGYAKLQNASIQVRSIAVMAALALIAVFDSATEGGSRFLLLAVLFIVCGNHRKALIGTSLLYTAALMYSSVQAGDLLANYQWMWIASLIPISYMRDTKERVSQFEKYFFYFFYPLHLWLLYGIWCIRNAI